MPLITMNDGDARFSYTAQAFTNIRKHTQAFQTLLSERYALQSERLPNGKERQEDKLHLRSRSESGRNMGAVRLSVASGGVDSGACRRRPCLNVSNFFVASKRCELVNGLPTIVAPHDKHRKASTAKRAPQGKHCRASTAKTNPAKQFQNNPKTNSNKMRARNARTEKWSNAFLRCIIMSFGALL